MRGKASEEVGGKVEQESHKDRHGKWDSELNKETDYEMDGQPYKPSLNPGACLTALPVELLRDIARHLPLRDLHHFGLVNRSLSSIAFPIAYARGIDPSMHPWTRATFARCIARDPRLGQMVKRLHFRYGYTYPVKVQQGPGPWGTLVFDKEAAQRYDMGTDSDLKILELALDSAYRIQELIIEDTSLNTIRHMSNHPLWTHQLSNALNQPPAFAHLRTVKLIFSRQVAGWVRLPPFLRLLSLPCITRLHLGGFIEPYSADPWPHQITSSTLRTLVLTDAAIHHATVASLITSCAALHEFTYYYTALKPPLFTVPWFHPRKFWAHHSWARIGAALRATQASSLKQLKMHYEASALILALAAAAGYRVYPADTGVVGSLAEFTALEAIEFPVDALIPGGAGPTYLAECLPTGLQFLGLRYNAITECNEDACVASILAALGTLSPTEPQDMEWGMNGVVFSVYPGFPVDRLRLVECGRVAKERGVGYSVDERPEGGEGVVVFDSW